MYVIVEPKARMMTMMMTKGMSDNLFILLPLLLLFIITHREITISGVVSNLESDNTTPSLTRSFKRRSSFGAQSGCNR